jgi:hypothetical protein
MHYYQKKGPKLQLFENKIMRKIFVPKKDELNGQFRIL